MKMSSRKTIFAILGLFTVVSISQIIVESNADARAGGGRSGGFRGSRSYSSPARPSQPGSPASSKAVAPAQQPNSMFGQPGGFMRTFGTAMLGGFLGSMLFSGIGNAFGGGGASAAAASAWSKYCFWPL